MIWGKTTKQKRIEQELADLHWFAWRPVKLVNGQWVWWERLRRIFCVNWDTCWYDYYISPISFRQQSNQK